jgi:hypothetical protein
MMRRLNNNKGVALVFSFLIMTFLLAFSGIFLLRVSAQRSAVQREKNLINAYYLAEAGAQAGLSRLNMLINAYLLTTINAADGNTVSSRINQFVSLNTGLGLLSEFAMHMGVAQLKVEDDYAVHTGMPVEINGGQYQYVIRIRQKGSPSLVSEGTWDFSYYYTVDSLGQSTGISRKVLASGDFTVRVQKGDFAKQAIFKSTDYNTKPGALFTASSADIADKITWQEVQP